MIMVDTKVKSGMLQEFRSLIVIFFWICIYLLTFLSGKGEAWKGLWRLFKFECLPCSFQRIIMRIKDHACALFQKSVKCSLMYIMKHWENYTWKLVEWVLEFPFCEYILWGLNYESLRKLNIQKIIAAHNCLGFI